ncbi:MAG: hypothetical protein V3U23_10525 [Kiloniellales bacterium]
MRWLLLAAAAVMLSGCGLPPIFTVASLAFDFASYGSTGKTVTDHGLSMVLQQDCALLRGLQSEVCVEEGSELASKKPVKEPETSASRRVAYLEEEAHRMTPRRATGPDDGAILRSAFVTDPAIAPQPVAAGPRPELSQARPVVLDEVAYLGDDARPEGELSQRQQLGGGYLSQGMALRRSAWNERETNG